MRFHSKYHSKSHHSTETSGYPDSASDPIASHEYPFEGEFVINGPLIASTASFTDSLSSLEVDDIIINNTIPTLSVDVLTLVTGFAPSTDGSNLISIPVSGVVGAEATANKDTPFGYAGLDSGGRIDASAVPTTLNLVQVLNGVGINEYLTEFDLSSTVAPLISSDNVYGRELPVEMFPDSIKPVNLLEIPSTQTLVKSIYTHYSLTASPIIVTLWNPATINDRVTFINYSGGSNTLSSDDQFKSDSLSSYSSITINNNEVLDFIFDGTNWLLI